MRRLIYSANTSLDGYVADRDGSFDWSAPEMRDFAASWRAADKIVYSRAGTAVRSARTRVEAQLDPAQVRAMVADTDHDVAIGGATLAGQALAAGLVDELHTFVSPVVVGGGTRWLPDGVRLDLELLDTLTFANGVVHLHHRVVR